MIENRRTGRRLSAAALACGVAMAGLALAMTGGCESGPKAGGPRPIPPRQETAPPKPASTGGTTTPPGTR